MTAALLTGMTTARLDAIDPARLPELLRRMPKA